MSKQPNKKDPKWLANALMSLKFFETSPEYKHEFKHDYFASQLGISKPTLYRCDKYMKEFQRVKDLLKEIKVDKSLSEGAPISGDNEKIAKLEAKVAEQAETISTLQLRLNDCYQILEDQGIDPEFVYPKRLKKHKEA
ncbi:hypothetical protein GTH32_18425 [Alteromonas sp. 345S023]|uniref:Uncharacterized protein n=1 Tax=Alteromonas profundi TaxID=2696062 RepID=A0A7X5RMU8_9ALTE|nr:hypothetical protein [Alteromonas profundi]NDV93149.1 hypothetical protein [Alteromonas profundi]